MGQHRPFGFSCGSGSVNDESRIIGVDVSIRLGIRRHAEKIIIFVRLLRIDYDALHSRSCFPDQGFLFRAGKDQFRSRILNKVLHLGFLEPRIQGHGYGTDFLQAEVGNHEQE